MLNRTIAPPIKDAIEFNLSLKPFEKHTLDNGVPVYAVNAGAEEVLQLEWVYYAGNSFEKRNLVPIFY
jgi:zinc protease